MEAQTFHILHGTAQKFHNEAMAFVRRCGLSTTLNLQVAVVLPRSEVEPHDLLRGRTTFLQQPMSSAAARVFACNKGGGGGGGGGSPVPMTNCGCQSFVPAISLSHLSSLSDVTMGHEAEL